MSEIDPELKDDRDVQEEDIDEIELPDFDESQFEIDDDFEYVDEEGEDDGDQNEE